MNRAPSKRPLKVGIVLPSAEGLGERGGNAPSRWGQILAMAQSAEALGFDSVWIPDHLIFRSDEDGVPPSGWWECWSLLAALAAATTRVEIGPFVSCTSFRNPALLAKMADTVDEISSGRLVLALGAGWNEREYHAFGFPFDHRVARFEEALQIIHGLLRNGHVDFQGTYYSARDCELRPRGPRPGGPPIMVGANGERMLRLAARYADAWNADWVNRAEALPALRAGVDAACAAVGRDPATLQRTISIMVDVPGRRHRPGESWASASWSRAKPANGSAEDLAAFLRTYAAAGIVHVQLWLEPISIAGVEGFAPVLELLDRG